jgi:diguanylate cyclase (GGDEF)-like protein/PAS domain S-box-containing protein
VNNVETVMSLGQLLQVSEAIYAGRNLDDLLGGLINRAVAMPGVDTVRILLLDEDGSRLVPQAGIGFAHLPLDDDAGRVTVGTGFAGRIAASRKPLLIADLRDHELSSTALEAAGVRSVLGVPLLNGDRLLGVMHIGSYERRAFGHQSIAAVQSIADQVSLTVLAIEREQELITSETRFRALFQDAPIGVLLVDLSQSRLGRIILVNAAFTRMTGFTQDQLLQLNFTELLDAEDQAPTLRALSNVASGELGGYIAEREIATADQGRIWIRSSVSGIQKEGVPGFAVIYVEDITSKKLIDQVLATRALTDPLTGLANRHLLTDHLELALRQFARTGELVGVLYLDLDGFKHINDLHGHDAGDRVLQEVAARLSRAVRETDTVGRLGGDEFVVICPSLNNADELYLVAERILRALDPAMIVGDLEPLAITASVGAAIAEPRNTPEELLRRADLAMYEAKRTGRRSWREYAPAMDTASRHRQATELVINEALQQNLFRLHYQPIIDLTSGLVAGAEALLRIEHPARGLMLPHAFIDTMESSDLAGEVEDWVLSTATKQMALWSSSGLDQLSVNISGRLAASGHLCANVMNSIERAGIDPRVITVEMTERSLVYAGPTVINDLNTLSQQGVSVAIDDFGTGFASLTYLQQFPVSIVKIDRSFISGLTVNPRADAIVGAVIALGSSLDMRVIAEGVERAEQEKRLIELGCPLAQGYRFASPLPAAEFVLAGSEGGRTDVQRT